MSEDSEQGAVDQEEAIQENMFQLSACMSSNECGPKLQISKRYLSA